MKVKTVQLCEVKLPRQAKEKREILPAIRWLDLKISEYIDKCRDCRYPNSRSGVMEYGEIVGTLKCLYMMDVITKEECNTVIQYING
jgi:hypothetical protein